MQQVKRAALAPAEPSGTDRAVAAQAGQVEAQARREKNRFEEEGVLAENAPGHQGSEFPGAKRRPGGRPYRSISVGGRLNTTV